MATPHLDLNPLQAERFASLALACLHREFPNKIAHALNSLEDVKSPRQLTPAFYGCYDWHSAVHSHWTLVRLSRLFPETPFAEAAQRALHQSLTEANITGEFRYLTAEGRESFERPYGLAWLLQLVAELTEWNTPEALAWAHNLAPLEHAITARLTNWLAHLPRPVRSGEHTNTAFALGLTWDYAASTCNSQLQEFLRQRILHFYLADKHCPLAYEPSGEDFLSPCLAQADLLRRVLPPTDFAPWFTQFLPQLHFHAAEITNDTDGKLGHLIGLDLTRAWMLLGIAAALPADYPQLTTLHQLAAESKHSGLSRINRHHYHGAHWLGTFAVYLLTRRGLPET